MIEVLIIGVGSIGERHLRCFQRTGRARLSLCDANDDLRERIATKYQVERRYRNFEDALDAPPAAAVVATPAHLHVSMARRLAEAGVHLLIEKPLSTSTAGIDELAELVERKSLVAAVAYVFRTHPALAAMQRALADGRFGKPLQLTSVSGQHFPTYRPAYREIYYASHAAGGGAIQDALTHHFNYGEFLVGPIEKLVADAAHQALPGVDVEDTAHVLARHGDLLACYSLNQHQAPSEGTITVACENGTVRFDMVQHRWQWMVEPGAAWNYEETAPLERDDVFAIQADHFLDALEGRCTPACSLAEGRQTLNVNLGALKSVREGGWIRVAAHR